MDVREHDLPGVGKKFALVTREGERMTVIIHHSGPREIYLFKPKEDFPSQSVRLEDPEARKLGAILSGAYFQPAVAESMEMVMDQLTVEWHKVADTSPLARKTIMDAEIRKRSGASVIAILRGGAALPNPDPGERIQAGDTLLVVGSREQIQAFHTVAGVP